MTLPLRPLTLSLAALLATPAWAQTPLKPGLWEHSMQVAGDARMEAAMAKAQERMARMPPEQRQQMEAMMANQGVALGAKAGTVKVCLSKEAAERGEPPPSDGRCRHETTQRSGGTIKFRFTCQGEPPASGEGEYTVEGPTRYRGQVVMNTVVKGQPQRTEMRQTGQWLSADCGAIKPFAVPAR